MKKFLKLAAVMIFAVAVVCTTGCKKKTVDDDNNSGIVAPTHPTGAINGLFSVSADKQVYFSQGNLQYQASTNTWRFAENQWDYVGTQTPDYDGHYGGTVVGSDNRNISSIYTGWIDLFGWGTSGYHNESDTYNTNFYPYSYSRLSVNETYNTYGYGPSINMPNPDLVANSAQYDWGVHNMISNGGNTVDTWRILTSNEWEYVLFNRETVSEMRFTRAEVNNINGVILFPDNWHVDYYVLDSINQNPNYSTNRITASEWRVLENKGAVFLPDAGYRIGNSVYNCNYWGKYWTSTNYLPKYGVDFRITSSTWTLISNRYEGLSVRLVQDYQ